VTRQTSRRASKGSSHGLPTGSGGTLQPRRRGSRPRHASRSASVLERVDHAFRGDQTQPTRCLPAELTDSCNGAPSFRMTSSIPRDLERLSKPQPGRQHAHAVAQHVDLVTWISAHGGTVSSPTRLMTRPGRRLTGAHL